MVRTLFGTLRLASPRWHHCPCRRTDARRSARWPRSCPSGPPRSCSTWSPSSPAWSPTASARLLAELLPLGRRLHATAIRRHTQATAERLDDELGPSAGVHRRLPADWEAAAPPDLPLTVGLDGGYVHACEQPRTRGMVRGDRRQINPRRRAGEVLRVRADLRHQAQAAPARAAQGPGDAGQPAGHVPHRRRRPTSANCPCTSTRRPST